MYTAAAQSYHSVAAKVDKSAWKYMYTQKWLYVYAYYSLIAYLLLNISHDGSLCNSFSSSLFRTFCLFLSTVILFPVLSACCASFFILCSLLSSLLFLLLTSLLSSLV